MRRNFKTITILFSVSGMLMAVCGIIAREESVRRMFLVLACAFVLSAAVQYVLFKRKKELFKDRPSRPE